MEWHTVQNTIAKSKTMSTAPGPGRSENLALYTIYDSFSYKPRNPIYVI